MNKNIILFSISLLVSSQAIGMWTPVPVPAADALATPRDDSEKVSKAEAAILRDEINRLEQEFDNPQGDFYPLDAVDRARTLKRRAEHLLADSKPEDNLKLQRSLIRSAFGQTKRKAEQLFFRIVEERALGLAELDMGTLEPEARQEAVEIVTQLEDDYYSTIAYDENLTGEEKEEILTAIMEAHVNVTQN